jgi:hypothetical protein
MEKDGLMFKRLRIAVPLIQVLAVVGVYALPKLVHGTGEFYIGIFAAQSLVNKMNFPLMAVWSVCFWALDRATPYLPTLTGVFFAVAIFVIAVLVVSSVALFWYFVIAETEMRSYGRSILRSTDRLKELLIIGLLFCLGAGTFIYAYSYVRSCFYFRMAEAILGGSLLVAWGVVFVVLSVHDAILFSRNKGQWPVSARKEK